MLQANSTLIRSETGMTLVSALGKPCKLFDGEVVDITMQCFRRGCDGVTNTLAALTALLVRLQLLLTLPRSDDPTALSERRMDKFVKTHD